MIQDLELGDLVAKVDALKAERVKLENILQTKKKEANDFLSNYRQKILQIRSRIENMKFEESMNPLVKPVYSPIQPRAINQIDADYRIRLATSTSLLEHTQEEYDRLKAKLQKEKNTELKKAKNKKRDLDELIESTNALKVQNTRIKQDIRAMKAELERLQQDTLSKREMLDEYNEKTTLLATEAEQIVQKHYKGYSRTMKFKYK